MSTTKIFNTQLFNFATVLVNRFPTDKELKLGLTGVETLSRVNPKKNVEIFTMYVYKYRDQIMNKDEKFILDTDFISENPDLNSNGASDIMQRLKLNWSELNVDDKENIWKYLKVLITLTDKYIKETLDK
tara:strand:- start:3656 stop:4045 length:390 start_codon:yes stop_codon:yes gene_type:complete